MHPRAPVPTHLLRRPFLLTEARAAGVPTDVLRPPRCTSPHRGVRAHESLERTLPVRAAAASLVLPSAALLTEWTALRLLQLPTPLGVPDPGDGLVQARVPTSLARPRIRGVRVSWLREHDLFHPLRTTEVLALLPDGVPALRLQHPLAAWCDVAPSLFHVDAVALGDAVRRDWASQEQMEHAVEQRSGRPGARALRLVLADVRHQVDSPMETEARTLFTSSGLPEPRCGQWIPDASGRMWQVDMVWFEQRVVVEHDGDVHRVKGKDQWRHDEDKRTRLRENGWTVVVLVGGSLDRHRPWERAKTVDRVRRALASA